MPATKTVTAKTKLGDLLKINEQAVAEVLANFGVIHCAHCEIDENQTVEAACNEHSAPTAAVVKALAAAVK
ncbi:MAG: hypothetical protein IT462_01550 [Planctomycetes bacterium]|nr:hypothetical protein [Planctomycetota bacterium]